RPRLTTAAEAGDLLRAVAQHAEVITPSWPGETGALLGLGPDVSADQALEAAQALGSTSTVLTCGREGALVAADGTRYRVPAPAAPRVVDQTGAGDCLTGTLAARLALGDSLVDAVRLAVAAAALSVQGQGGTGHVPTLEETRRMIRDQRSDEAEPR
ncbi:MAG: carbohydrate kinase family protein, partial [Actinomycetota bacterium]|nr:carbohydrate kinase family protein [Actinomycetota bacterium]